jgi:hypothetical protein
MPIRKSSCTCAALVATFAGLTAGLTVAPASAQDLSMRLVCANSHGPYVEPIVDREDQRFQASEASCKVEGGPMDGAVLTQSTFWHFDKNAGAMLSSHSVARKPGSLLVSGATAGTMAILGTGGWSASGKGRYLLATGAATSLDGKTFSWTGKPEGYGYVLTVVVDR